MPRARRLLFGLCVLALSAPSAAPAIASPHRPWAKLAAEDRGAYRWSVKAGAPVGSKRPCLLVAASWRTGPLEYHRSTYRQCAPTAALSPTGPPLIASAAQPSSPAATVKISAIGMIFAPPARRVRITFAGGRTETLRLRKFDPAQADAVKLAPFRYAAFAIGGEWCAQRLVSVGAAGAVLWDSGVDEYACGSQGEPHFAAPNLLP